MLSFWLECFGGKCWDPLLRVLSQYILRTSTECNFMLINSPVLVQDNPDLFAVMEKTRLLIFHGVEPEVRFCIATFAIDIFLSSSMMLCCWRWMYALLHCEWEQISFKWHNDLLSIYSVFFIFVVYSHFLYFSKNSQNFTSEGIILTWFNSGKIGQWH